MTFTPRNWLNRGESPGSARTPLDAEGQEDQESRLAAYADSLHAEVVVAAPTGVAATDTANLQAAFDQGGLIQLRPGTYVAASQLTIPSGTTVRGAGPGAGGTIVQCAPTFSSNLLLRNADATNGNVDIVVEALEMDGNKANRAANEDAVLVGFYGSSASPNRRIAVHNCYIHDSPGIGGSFQHVRSGWWSGNEVAGCVRDAFVCYFSCQNVQIAGNYHHECADDLIALNAELGTSTGNVMRDITVVGNTLATNSVRGGGVAVRGVSGCTVSGNVIRSTFSYGVEVSSYGLDPARDVIVSDNVLIDAGASNTGGAGHGIGVMAAPTGDWTAAGEAACVNVAVSGNTIRNARSHGIRAISYSATGALTSLRISDNDVVCGSLYASGRGVFVDGVTITRPAIISNRVFTAQNRGIHVGDATNAVAEPRISDNTVLDSGQGTSTAGIYVQRTSSPIISGNRSSGATQTYGLTIDTVTSGQAIEYGNDLAGNATGAISIASTTFGATTGGHRHVQTAQDISGAATIGLATSNFKILTLTGNVTSIAVTGAASGVATSAELHFVQGGAGGFTLATTWKWPGGTDPVLSTAVGAIDRVRITTVDGGTTVYAELLGQAYA